MRLIEWDARIMLETLGIKVPEGTFFPYETQAWPPQKDWTGAFYLKAQILQGRRGVRGLVRRCASAQEANQYFSDMHAQLSSEDCAGFVCVSEQPHIQEYFVSCDLDPATGNVRFHMSQQGGGSVAQAKTWFVEDLEHASLEDDIRDLGGTLIQAMTRLDALSIEINPLARLADGSLVALDAKIELDDAAAFRHPEWDQFSALSRWGELHGPREQAYVNLLKQYETKTIPLGKYVELDGDIAMILAGGGASLVAMDSLIQVGGKPGNYLEIAGNPDPSFLKRAAAIVFSRPGLQAIWIAGSFANFTDIQITLRATREAIEEAGLYIPVFIRRDGPHVQEALQETQEWAERLGISLVFDRADKTFLESARQLVDSLNHV